jgi:hypothetical protein
VAPGADPADTRGKEAIGQPAEPARIVVREDWEGRDRLEHRHEMPGMRLEVHVSPDRLKRIREWRQHPSYGEVEYEALFRGGDPENPDPPTGRALHEVANFGRFDRATDERTSVRRRPERRSGRLFELAGLIDEFLSGKSDAQTRLAKAIRWNPGNAVTTRRLFDKFKEESGLSWDAAYMQLAMMALSLIKASKDRTNTQRDETPQPIRLQRNWLRASSKAKVVPRDVPVAKYVGWFRNEVTRIIKNEILIEYDEGKKVDDRLKGKENDRDIGKESLSIFDVIAFDRFEKDQRDIRLVDRDDEQDETPATVAKTTQVTDKLRFLVHLLATTDVRVSPLQREILALAQAEDLLKDYRDIAERLSRDRDVVKNAILRLTRKLGLRGAQPDFGSPRRVDTKLRPPRLAPQSSRSSDLRPRLKPRPG